MKQAARKPNIRLKRAYEPPSTEDGKRILVDRLWPRGLSKAKASIDDWYKEIAPSTELRQWFNHDPARWREFRRRYEIELSRNKALVNDLRSIARRGTLTLLYSARDEAHNQAVVIHDKLKQAQRVAPSRNRSHRHESKPRARRT